MIITPLPINGSFLLEMKPFVDKRGSFARQFCLKELAVYGIDFTIKQCNISRSYKKGVLRGMHFQRNPYPEIKIVSCLQGSIYDVILDLRKDSPSYLKWFANELSSDNNKMVYVPPGVAHGFQTLEDNSIVYYQLSEFFMPDFYAGVRFDDPAFNIKWPKVDKIINERDKNYALWK